MAENEFDSSAWTGGPAKRPDIRKILKGRTLGKAASDAIEWFRERIRTAGDDNRNITGSLPRTKEALMTMRGRQKGENSIGKMYFFVYDPKHKDTLPYYDKFPLIFPIEFYDDGFLGINLHYLDIRNRFALLSVLMTLATDRRMDENTKLKISYQALKSMSSLHKPCIKRYLTGHVRSKFILIHPKEWEDAIFLPVESFEKAPMSKVWRDSRRNSA